MAEKTIIEEDLKGLEKEIDAAVDRLFVEKGGEPLKSIAPSTPLHETFQKAEEEVEWEMPAPAPVPTPTLAPTLDPVASYHAQPLEKLETQLLSLEWEINKENLGKTASEVLELKENFKRSPDISSVLNRMLAVLNFMTQNEEGIQPHRIQILLDSK